MANNKCIKSRSKYSFFNFMTGIITQLHKNGQHKTWQHYRATLNSFMRFRQNKDLSLRSTSSDDGSLRGIPQAAGRMPQLYFLLYANPPNRLSPL